MTICKKNLVKFVAVLISALMVFGAVQVTTVSAKTSPWQEWHDWLVEHLDNASNLVSVEPDVTVKVEKLINDVNSYIDEIKVTNPILNDADIFTSYIDDITIVNKDENSPTTIIPTINIKADDLESVGLFQNNSVKINIYKNENTYNFNKKYR